MRLVIFDLDGTLIESYMREGENWPYKRVVVLPNVLHKLELLASGGVTFAIATNQAGVAFGYQTPEETFEKMSEAMRKLNFFFGAPFSFHLCMAHPTASVAWSDPKEVARRKPSPAMLKEAMKSHDTKPEDTVMVGDMDTDRQAAHAAGVAFRWAPDFFTT